MCATVPGLQIEDRFSDKVPAGSCAADREIPSSNGVMDSMSSSSRGDIKGSGTPYLDVESMHFEPGKELFVIVGKIQSLLQYSASSISGLLAQKNRS
jgi:hypothetical protein